VEDVKAKLGMKAKYRCINNKAAGAAYTLQETTATSTMPILRVKWPF